jgi:hypothetical protein
VWRDGRSHDEGRRNAPLCSGSSHSKSRTSRGGAPSRSSSCVVFVLLSRSQFSKPEMDYVLDAFDPEMELVNRYIDQVIMFGYMTLFVTAFPISPLLGYLSNMLQVWFVCSCVWSFFRTPGGVTGPCAVERSPPASRPPLLDKYRPPLPTKHHGLSSMALPPSRTPSRFSRSPPRCSAASSAPSRAARRTSARSRRASRRAAREATRGMTCVMQCDALIPDVLRGEQCVVSYMISL